MNAILFSTLRGTTTQNDIISFVRLLLASRRSPWIDATFYIQQLKLGVVKVHCNILLFDSNIIEEIDHSYDNVEWSYDKNLESQ